jgi:1-deoxy-D-xylulose-5-phosphate reductoisomerase
MIEFIDGSILAQLGITDMALPIQYALSFPERLDNLDGLDFNKIKSLDFDIPDLNKFPCLEFAIDAAKTGGTLPCVLNAADEEVVKAFLEDRIKFHEIPILIERIITAHKVNKNPNLDEIFVCDDWARNRIKELVCL